MNTNVFTRVCKISLAACLALVLGTSFANAGHYGCYGGYGGYGQGYSNYGQSYSRNYQPSYQGYGYGQRSYNPPQYGGYSGSSHYCRPNYQPQPHYGFSGGYQGGSYGRYR